MLLVIVVLDSHFEAKHEGYIIRANAGSVGGVVTKAARWARLA